MKISSNTAGNSKQIIEKGNEHPEWLPEGWRVDFRTRKSGANMGAGYKCYIDPSNGYKFYSKPEVLRYLDTIRGNSNSSKKEKDCTVVHSPSPSNVESAENILSEESEATNKKINSKTTGNLKQYQIVEKGNEHPKWLPDGWRVDFRTRKSGANKGAGYKCYIDLMNGYKFYSKSEVLRHLDAIKGNSSGSKKEKGCSLIHSPSNVAVEKSTMDDLQPGSTKEVQMIGKDPVAVEKSMVDDLPPGWTKEVKIRKSSNGIRKDPYYTDPVNGYVFRSKKDAMRYIESGDISKCLFKPNKRQIQDEDKSTPSFTAKRQKLKQPATKRQLFGDNEASEKSSIDLLDADSSEKGDDVKMSAGMMIAPVPSAKTVVKMHSLEDAAANPPEMNEKSAPADVEEKNCVLYVMKNADENNHSSPVISKNKKRFNGPHRFSRRLAGIEPHQVDDPDNMINEQTLQLPKRSLRKCRTTLDVDLVNVSSQKLDEVPKIDHVDKIPGKSPHESSKRDFRGQPHQLESEKVEDDKPEQHQYSPSHDYSSPGLKGAMKTTGDLPVLNNGLASEAYLLKENKLNAGEIRRIGAQGNKSSSKKNHCIPCRASKRLAGFEPEYTNSMNCEKLPEYKDRKSKGEVNAESLQSEGMPAKELADLACTYIDAPRNGGSSKRHKKSPKISPRTDEQLAKLGDKQLDDEKSEPKLSFAFHYSWSDPSVEFAIKTLTGALPAEDSVDNEPVLVPEKDMVETNNLSKNVAEGSNDKNDSVDNGAVLVPETDVVEKNKLSKSVAEGSNDKNDSVDNGAVLVPETDVVEKNKLSKSVAEGSNDKNDSVVSGPVLVPETDVVENNKLSWNVTEGSNDKSPQATSKKSKKKEPSLPRRLSKRLAGHEPEAVPAERALEYAPRKLCKDEPTAVATSGNGASKQLDVVGETELALQACNCSERRVHVESSNESEKSYEAQIFPNEQLLKVGAKKVNETFEPELSLPFGDSWSDPCLEFAIKTLTGALPVDADAEILPVMTPDLNDPPNMGLLESLVEKCINEEGHDDLNHLQNSIYNDKVCQHTKQPLCQPELMISSMSCEDAPKFTFIESRGDDANITRNLGEAEPLHTEAIDMACQPSKQLLGQPELRTSSTSCENTPIITAREPAGDEANITKNLNEGESLNIETENECQLAHKSRNIDTLIQEETLNNIGKFLEEDSAPTEQPQLETGTENQEKSESLFSAPLMDSWSDPCLEFAYKTLTGAIPVVENFAQCFHEPANNFRSQKDSCSLLPDFGSPSFSQSDISFHYNVEKSVPGQQSSMSSAILPPEKVSSHCFTGFDSQKHYSQCSKNSQGR